MIQQLSDGTRIQTIKLADGSLKEIAIPLPEVDYKHSFITGGHIWHVRTNRRSTVEYCGRPDCGICKRHSSLKAST